MSDCRESGQDAAEYAVLLALIAVVIVVAVLQFGDELAYVYERIDCAFGALTGGWGCALGVE